MRHDDGLDDEEPGRAEGAGDRLGELAERVGVVVDAEVEPPAPPRRGEVLVAASRRPRTAGRRRCRQPAGSERSSTSSTVMAPSRCLLLVAHGDGQQVVGRQPLGHLALRGVRRHRVDVLDALRQRHRRRLAQQALEVRPRRGTCRSAPRTAVVPRRPGRRSTPATPGRGCWASASATVAVGPRMMTSGVMSPPAVPSP